MSSPNRKSPLSWRKRFKKRDRSAKDRTKDDHTFLQQLPIELRGSSPKITRSGLENIPDKKNDWRRHSTPVYIVEEFLASHLVGEPKVHISELHASSMLQINEVIEKTTTTTNTDDDFLTIPDSGNKGLLHKRSRSLSNSRTFTSEDIVGEGDSVDMKQSSMEKNGKQTYVEVDNLLNLAKTSIEREREHKPLKKTSSTNSATRRFSKLLTRKQSAPQFDENHLLNAVSNYDYITLQRILNNNSGGLEYDINFLYPPGVSALHQACVLGDIDITRLLVEKGANVNTKTWSKLSPIKIATLYGHFDIAQLLLTNGADAEDVINGFQN